MATNADGEQRSLDLLGSTALFGGLVFLATTLYSIQFPWRDALSVIALAVAIGLASFSVGALFGFLFAIPRVLASDDEPQPGAATAAGATRGWRHQPNSNLEQISDWLTKILLGAGLTQIGTLDEQLALLAAYLGPALGGKPASGPFAAVLVIGTSTAGFITGYLFTRTRLAQAFKSADDQLDLVESQLRQLDPGRSPDPDDWTATREVAPAAGEEDRKRAEALLEQVRSLERDNVQLDGPSYRRLARILRRAGRHQDAVNAYIRASELEPDDPRPLNSAGVLQARDLKNLDAAQALYERALKVEPGYSYPLYNLACLWARKGDADKAIDYLERALGQRQSFRLSAIRDASDGGPFEELRSNDRFKALIS